MLIVYGTCCISTTISSHNPLHLLDWWQYIGIILHKFVSSQMSSAFNSLYCLKMRHWTSGRDLAGHINIYKCYITQVNQQKSYFINKMSVCLHKIKLSLILFTNRLLPFLPSTLAAWKNSLRSEVSTCLFWSTSRRLNRSCSSAWVKVGLYSLATTPISCWDKELSSRKQNERNKVKGTIMRSSDYALL